MVQIEFWLINILTCAEVLKSPCQFQSYSSNSYINGKVLKSTTYRMEIERFYFIKKNHA